MRTVRARLVTSAARDSGQKSKKGSLFRTAQELEQRGLTDNCHCPEHQLGHFGQYRRYSHIHIHTAAPAERKPTCTVPAPAPSLTLAAQ